MKKRGFTLVELLLVIAIIGTLASIVLVNSNKARDRAQASHIAATFHQIYLVWRMWQVDTGSEFIDEDIYGDELSPPNVNPEAICHDEPPLSVTDLFQNVSGQAGWDGPYLSTVPKGPWGREYSYDNDLNTWPLDGKWGGVNMQVQWCSGEESKYLKLAPYIDEIYDGGDGPDLGKFRWDVGSQGGYGILIAPSPGE